MAKEFGASDGVIVTGSTVEDAVKRALLQLNVSLDEIDVDVLSSGSRGVLGMGREDARVRVRLRSQPYSEEEAADEDEEPEAEAAGGGGGASGRGRGSR